MAGSRFLEAGTDLQEAAGIGGDNERGSGLQYVFDFALSQALGHGRFRQIVTAGASTTDVGFGQFDKLGSGDSADQGPRFLGDALRMGEVAGIVIRDSIPVRPCDG